MPPEDEPEADRDVDPDEEGEPSLADDLADDRDDRPSLGEEAPGLADDLEPDPDEDEPLSQDLDVDADAGEDEPLSQDLDVDADEAEGAPLAADLEGGGVDPNIEVDTGAVEDDEPDADADADPEASEAIDATPDEGEEDEVDPDDWPDIYALKTTINQEKTVMKMVKNKADKAGIPVMAILAPADLRGYILIESTDRPGLERITRNVPHARGMVEGDTDLAEVEHFLTPKPAVAGIAEGDIVELTSGPFKGERARVKRIDEGNEEITVELFEAMVPIPVTVRGDHVRVLEKEEETDR